ncbi:hypothetical protein Taro_010903 [Colocasia esculenta]|uniref:RNase H type-1 domain-containing protein n=1 Tax=Colocasia esculenta TaxID=4460 RepID=A0A843UB33_COLES|nr:hypothetical protein [Colocasia esculenta]
MVAHSLVNVQFKEAPSADELKVLQRYAFSPQFSLKQLKLIRWIPPIVDFCLNVDGACKGNPGVCGGGDCIRDSKGSVLVAFAHFYGPGNSITAEVRALCDGLRLASNLGIQLSMVNCDSLTLVNSFKMGRCPSWFAYHWWRDAKVFVQRKSFLLKHVFRECNQVADSLANHGISNKLTQVFWGQGNAPHLCDATLSRHPHLPRSDVNVSVACDMTMRHLDAFLDRVTAGAVLLQVSSKPHKQH